MKTVQRIGLLRGHLDKILSFILLLYSIVMLMLPIFKKPSFLEELPFLVFVPGYAFAIFVLPRMRTFEKTLASIGLSIAFLAGSRAILDMFALRVLFSELMVVSILSATCFTAKILEPKKKLNQVNDSPTL